MTNNYDDASPSCAFAFTCLACSTSVGRLYFPVTRYWLDASLQDGSSRLSQEQVMFLTCRMIAPCTPRPSSRYGEGWRLLTNKRRTVRKGSASLTRRRNEIRVLLLVFGRKEAVFSHSKIYLNCGNIDPWERMGSTLRKCSW